jgi:AcrR family transcriptional regulator
VNRTIPRADARLNRERLVAAARELFGERGVSVEMREIAERAGLAVGTIYRHFLSKDDLILGVLDDALATASATADAADRCQEPLSAVLMLLEHSISLTATYGWLVEAYNRGLLPERCRAEAARMSIEYNLQGRFERILQRCVDAGELRPQLDVATAAALLKASAALGVCKPLLAREPAGAVARRLLDGLLAGWRA